MGLASHLQSALFISFILIVLESSASQEEAGFADKYVARSYFDEHDSFIDSEFDEFIESRIVDDICRVLENGSCVAPIIQSLHRDLVGEGSHRSLSTLIKLNLKPSMRSLFSSHSCELVVIERLPLGVFADPFELEHRAYTDAAVFGDTNLELPSFLSNRSVVEVHINIASESVSASHNGLEVSLGIPLHARYQPLGSYFSKIVFGKPDLLLCCISSSDEAHKFRRKCSFIPTNQVSERQSDPLVWKIPCGIKEHSNLVSLVTFGFAIVAALIIAAASIFYPNDRKLKRS